jgi:Peptidase A4 family
MRKIVLGLAVVAAATAAATALGAGTSGATSADVSSNWAGYVATGLGSTSTTASASTAFTDVTATWRQPKAVCTPGQSTSAALWVGLGGYSESSQELEQTGTSADCNSAGKPSYYAWYELVPADSVTVKLKILPGDLITSSVVVDGTDVLVQVKDRTRGTNYTKHLPMASPDLTSAEWIAEAPAACGGDGGCRQLALTDFGSVAFTNTYAKGNGVGGTITSPSWTSTAIQLVPRTHRVFGYEDPNTFASTAGALANGLSTDGKSFTVTWQSNAGA